MCFIPRIGPGFSFGGLLFSTRLGLMGLGSIPVTGITLQSQCVLLCPLQKLRERRDRPENEVRKG